MNVPAEKSIRDSKDNDENNKDGVGVEDDGGEVPVEGGEVAEEEEGEEDEPQDGKGESPHGRDWLVWQEVKKDSTNEVAQGEAEKAAGGDEKCFLPSSSTVVDAPSSH